LQCCCVLVKQLLCGSLPICVLPCAQVLVLDVRSIRERNDEFQGSGLDSGPVDGPTACRYYCAKLPQCNVWSYCANGAGCASARTLDPLTCWQYTDAHPPRTYALVICHHSRLTQPC
jgi:hypothetical protein